MSSNNIKFSDKIIVSSCLLGTPCRYDGKDQKREFLVQLQEVHPEKVISVCPEMLGGMQTPRVPCERKGGKVISKFGKDETSSYNLGAAKALQIAQENQIIKAYLKSQSPMCGCGKIYDGNFTGKLVDGNGVFADALKNLNSEIIIESVD